MAQFLKGVNEKQLFCCFLVQCIELTFFPDSIAGLESRVFLIVIGAVLRTQFFGQIELIPDWEISDRCAVVKRNNTDVERE